MNAATPSHFVPQSRGPGAVGVLLDIGDRDLADFGIGAAVRQQMRQAVPRRLALVHLGHARVLVQVVGALADLVSALVPTSILALSSIEALSKYKYRDGL